ncbi:response regulator [Candidatus Gracilibacteria bacterium]|nr:response regulator [Candidatus Gracilibacteria bacterium]
MLHIILAEDEPDVRSFLQRALEYLYPKAQITAVEDGAAALATYERTSANLIVSDYRMPHLNGIELLRALRRISDTPFVLISADTSIIEDAYEAGASAVLRKPLGIRTLRATLYQWLPAEPSA